jgi:phage terminase Nu1 subunit (DNA packaging protein)
MKLYNSKAIASILDLSERRIRQLRDEGVISEYQTAQGLYDLIPSIHSYINFLRKGSVDDDKSEEHLDYNTERARLVRAKRLNEEYDLRVKEGELHSTFDVERLLSGMLNTFKKRIRGIPTKLAPILSKKGNKAEIHRILQSSLDEALTELSHMGAALGENSADGESAGDETSHGCVIQQSVGDS